MVSKPPPGTLEERYTRALVLKSAVVSAKARASALRTQSRWIIDSSRALLSRPRPVFRGSSDDPSAEDVASIRARLRTLIEGGVLPALAPSPMWAGVCRESRTCIACGRAIKVDEVEMEWTGPAEVTVVFHGRCVYLYRAMSDGNGRAE
jgi:hypothetical protein